MTPDQYVQQIIAKYTAPTGQFSPAERAATAIAPALRAWASTSLDNLSFSGSYAKGTAVRPGTDIDLFISLKAGTTASLKDIYESLHQFALAKGWSPRRQRVSIGITYLDLAIDLVPARIQAGYQNFHSLYNSRTGTWTQTNVARHISLISSSGKVQEIKAVKIWRNLRQLDFPSFFLELTVLEALKGRSTSALADNVFQALRYISSSLPTARVQDPSNTNNIISDDLSPQEKQWVVSHAQQAMQASDWSQIIW
jgi:hypothetical protein